MRTQSSDTPPGIENVLISLLRKASSAAKMTRVRSLSESTILLSRRAIRRANPGMDQKNLNMKFISLHYGEKLAQRLHEYINKNSL